LAIPSVSSTPFLGAVGGINFPELPCRFQHGHIPPFVFVFASPLARVPILTLRFSGSVCNTTLAYCQKRESSQVVDIKLAFSTPVCANVSLESAFRCDSEE
jgi:hypothetical protein